MTEAQVIEAIRSELATHGGAAPQGLSLVERALVEFPTSPAIWILRGDLIQIDDDDGRYSIDDALQSYRTALELDPNSAEANESVGHFLDGVADKPEEAKPYFQRALALGGGETAREGLEQVLEQLGRAE